MIACHPAVVSFPETHFFSATMPINPVLRRLKWYGKNDQQKISAFLQDHGYNISPFSNGQNKFTHHNWSGELFGILNHMAAAASKKLGKEQIAYWLEKTPRHLHYISSIECAGSKPRFIHMLREGKDVIGSLHLVTKEHPEEWNGKRSIKKCITWWNRDIKESLKYRDLPNHFFVVYNQLIEEPERVLKKLCDFFSIHYHPEMASQFYAEAPGLTHSSELWKKHNTSCDLKASRRLQDNFDESTIAFIADRAFSIDLSAFYH